MPKINNPNDKKPKKLKYEIALYKRWTGMKARVLDIKKRTSYLDKNVVVCNEWLNSFPSFYNWSISNGFQPHLELDRKNNDGNYSPQNYRWITHKENCKNRN